MPTGTAGRQKRPGLGVCTGACDDCTFARDRRGRVARRLPGPGSQARSGVRVRRDPRTICSGCRARSRRNRSGNSTTARTGGERTRVRWAWPRTNIACGAGRPPAGVSWRKGHLTRSEGDVGAPHEDLEGRNRPRSGRRTPTRDRAPSRNRDRRRPSARPIARRSPLLATGHARPLPSPRRRGRRARHSRGCPPGARRLRGRVPGARSRLRSTGAPARSCEVLSCGDGRYRGTPNVIGVLLYIGQSRAMLLALPMVSARYPSA